MRLPVALVVIVSAAASLALATDDQVCFQSREPQLRIKGCSQIIQRAPDDAAAYSNRAVAYGLAGDIDNAIADYTKAIEIVPNNATAYDNRSRAYASKGDYPHALEDATKASELIAKATAQSAVATPETLKKPKPPKSTAIVPKATDLLSPTKAIPKAGKGIDKETPASRWWSWRKF
jgi:tetratricopeptide (TPR) repeat protein